MTANEPDAVTWQRLFASLVGDAAVDAATIREFCPSVTPRRQDLANAAIAASRVGS